MIGETDYKKAAQALQSAPHPYATALNYAESLIELIEKENLTRFDGDNAKETDTRYRVQVGAYNSNPPAETQKTKVINAGIDAIIIQEDGMYKVQAGLYAVKANADAQLARVRAAGFDAFIKVLMGFGTAISPREITVGCTVTVLKNVTYDGKPFRTYFDKYDVIEVKGDRVVIGIGDTTTCAIRLENLALV